MLRDILNYKVQFISIFIMAFIGAFVFSGLIAESNGFETTIDDYYNQTNLADGWIYSNYLVDEFLEQVDLLGATTGMERQLVVDSQAKLNNDPHVTLHFVENNTISKFYPVEGKKLDIDDSEGVWLDKSFADARKLKIGDTIAFESNGMTIEKKIRGFGYSPEYIYNVPQSSSAPDYAQNGYAYMSHEAFPEDTIPYNVLNVKFDGTPEIYSQLLEYRLDGYYTSFLQRSGQYSADIISDSINQQNSVSAIYPPVFVLISMLILLTTMKRIISNQRTQIGVLKANGFKNRSIILHYLTSGFFSATIASALGVISGPIVFHLIAHPSRTRFFKFPYWNFIGYQEFIFVVVVIGLLSIAVSFFSIKDIVNESPSTIIKPMAPKPVKSDFIERLGIWKKFSFNFRWNYRDAKRNKFRAAMTIFGVIGCTVLLISGFGLYEKMDDSKNWYFDDVIHFESKLIIDGDAGSSQIDEVAKAVDGDKIMESYIEVSTDEANYGSLLVLNGTDLIYMTDDDHERIEIPDDEVSISQKMADILNVDVGDVITCKIVGSDEPVKIKIDRIHASPFSQGLVMSADKLEEIGLNYTPTAIITSQHVNENYSGIESVIYLDEMIDGWDEMEETTQVIIIAMIFFAVLLAIVILYNLNLISFIEMENDIATLKILGFKSSFLTKLLATQSLFFIAVGFIAGLPVSYYILTILLPAFGNKLYLVPSISLTNMLLTLAIILAVSFAMNLYFSRKIKKIDLADSIKTFE
jgi:putative ABC transport system permease protein